MTIAVRNCDALATTAGLFAGNAVFTVVALESQERYTFHFYRPNQGRQQGQLLARLLTGPDNVSSYSDLGVINPETGEVALSGKFAISGDKVTLPAAVARWIALLASTGAEVPAGIEIVHAGYCLACRRRLTVPYPANPYRNDGFGPECGAK